MPIDNNRQIGQLYDAVTKKEDSSLSALPTTTGPTTTEFIYAHITLIAKLTTKETVEDSLDIFSSAPNYI